MYPPVSVQRCIFPLFVIDTLSTAPLDLGFSQLPARFFAQRKWVMRETASYTRTAVEAGLLRRIQPDHVCEPPRHA
jgi:hypothetical protein